MKSAAPDAPQILALRAVLPDHVVHRTFAEETVVLNLQTGRYHGLNATGGKMIEVLVVSATVGEAARRLAEEYEQPLAAIQQDVAAFCTALVERGLLELRAAA